MTKKKIDISKEVAKIWDEAKENLRQLGQRTMNLAQKGEKEVVRASKIGKFQLDIVNINLKKENIFRETGKKTYEMHCKKGGVQPEKLTSLFKQIDKLNRQIRSKKAQIARLKKE